MLLNIIVFKNVKINAFTNPNYTDVEPEKAAKGLERAIIANFESDAKLVKSYENLDMYYIGTFDDETGVIVYHEPKFLFSPRETILKLVSEQVAKQKVLESNADEVEEGDH